MIDDSPMKDSLCDVASGFGNAYDRRRRVLDATTAACVLLLFALVDGDAGWRFGQHGRCCSPSVFHSIFSIVPTVFTVLPYTWAVNTYILFISSSVLRHILAVVSTLSLHSVGVQSCFVIPLQHPGYLNTSCPTQVALARGTTVVDVYCSTW